MKMYLTVCAFALGLANASVAGEPATATDAGISLYCVYGGSMAGILVENSTLDAASSCSAQCEYVMNSGKTHIERIDSFSVPPKKSKRLMDKDLYDGTIDMVDFSQNAVLTCGSIHD